MVQRAAPILLLVGLKYRGNVGSIIRAAVQADLFEAVYIIEKERRKEVRACIVLCCDVLVLVA